MNELELLRQKLKTISVDFNCGLEDSGLMCLTSYGSLRDLEETGAQVGEKVILDDDDELWVEAVLVKQDDDIMYARFEWDDIVVKDRRVGPGEVKTAFELIRMGKISLTPKDHSDLGPSFLMRLVSDAREVVERNEDGRHLDATLTARLSFIGGWLCNEAYSLRIRADASLPEERPLLLQAAEKLDNLDVTLRATIEAKP